MTAVCYTVANKKENGQVRFFIASSSCYQYVNFKTEHK